jgi:hypothetical protein
MNRAMRRLFSNELDYVLGKQREGGLTRRGGE